MSTVDELLAITKKLHAHLQQKVVPEQRDEYIKTIESLLGERDAYIGKLDPPYSEEEEQAGAEIVRYNQEIDTMLEVLMADIQTDIRLLKHQKQSNERYSNPYSSSSSADGMFYDKRK
ncbi:hypothetical protein [Bacillus marinisedimentorum]|uniref:hypothetical protein n=1 Tax=Bacillus marinisedimentorum TaxID=1821260 RepID=UPI0007E0EF2D|nr:hypothetical protein [Bacillus marinisedimentorum]